MRIGYGESTEAHDNPRATKAPLDDLNVAELSVPGLIYQIGVAPQRIDIVTVVDGLTFDSAWPNRIIATDPEKRCPIPRDREADLIRNKRAAARPQDLVDAGNLERSGRVP
jgi:hypothetical protein